MINFNRILPELFLGTHPRTNVDVQRLHGALRVSAVLNLQTDEDFARWRVDWARLQRTYLEKGIVVERVPIVDFDADDLRARLAAAVGALDEMLRSEHVVYLHCTAGAGRAPATAIAYLAWCRGWSIDRAHSFVTERRTCSPSMEAIRLAAADRAATLRAP